MSPSSHCLRIHLVVLLVSAEESNHDDPALVVHQADESIVICLDIEDHPTAFENTGLRMRLLNLVGGLPLCRLRDRTPGVVLRTGRLDPFVAGSCCEIALDDVGTHYNHRQRAYRLVP